MTLSFQKFISTPKSIKRKVKSQNKIHKNNHHIKTKQNTLTTIHVNMYKNIKIKITKIIDNRVDVIIDLPLYKLKVV